MGKTRYWKDQSRDGKNFTAGIITQEHVNGKGELTKGGVSGCLWRQKKKNKRQKPQHAPTVKKTNGTSGGKRCTIE